MLEPAANAGPVAPGEPVRSDPVQVDPARIEPVAKAAAARL